MGDKAWEDMLSTLQLDMDFLARKQTILDREQEMIDKEESLSNRQKEMEEYEKEVRTMSYCYKDNVFYYITKLSFCGIFIFIIN